VDRSVVESVPGVIYRVKAVPPFDVEFVTDELRTLTGYDADQFLGEDPEVRWIELVHPEDVPRVYEVITQALVGERPEIEFRFRRADGTEGWLLTRAQKLAGADGTPWLHGTAIDVTDRHRAEELRRQAASERARREEVEASRARMVAAGDQARRRLERDLHDGAQQRFVAVALTLKAIERQLGGDSNEAGALLAEARQELDEGLGELRELARGVHPAILTQQGLKPALRTLAERCSVPVTVEVALAGPLPETAETTAYFVVAEALTNVDRYAEASSAAVRVQGEVSRLSVMVSDDGLGGATMDGGSGLRGLADRVESLGGHLELLSEPGVGTQVVADLPLVPV
jgi:PAS domain S-box-containing protein